MKTLTLKARVFNFLDTKRAALIKRGSKATVPMSGVLDKAHGKLKSEAKDPSASYRMYHQMWLNDRGLYAEWIACGGVPRGQKGVVKGPHDVVTVAPVERVNVGPTNWELAEHHQQLADKYFALGVADDKAAAQNNATVQ